MFFVMLAGLTLFAPFLAHHVRERFALRAFQSRSMTEDADSKGRSSPVAVMSMPPSPEEVVRDHAKSRQISVHRIIRHVVSSIYWPSNVPLAIEHPIGHRTFHWPSNISLVIEHPIGQRTFHWPSNISLAIKHSV